MKSARIGGIYGKDARLRAAGRCTPETTLEAGLKARGHAVETFGHYANLDGRSFDVIHVHHFSYGATRAAVDSSPAAFVFPSHDGPALAALPVLYASHLALRFLMVRADTSCGL